MQSPIPRGMKIPGELASLSLDEETVQGEETIQGRKLYEEIRYVYCI